MGFLRSILDDLIEKRLWPLAIALLIAIVAVPLVLGRGGGTEVPPPPVTAAPSVAGEATAAAVEVVGPASAKARRGTTRNPFRRPPKADPSAAAPVDASPAAQPPAAPEPPPTDGGSGAEQGGSTPQTEPEPAPAATASAARAYRVTVRWGAAGRALGQVRPLTRLTPLGGLAPPVLLYLGVDAAAKRAAFLVAPAATSTGEGDCLERECRIVLLRAGEAQVVDVPQPGGDVRQHELQVDSIEHHDFGSALLARRSRLRVHADGRDVLRELIRDGSSAKAIGLLNYDYDLGLLVTVDRAAADGGASTAADPAAADPAAVDGAAAADVATTG